MRWTIFSPTGRTEVIILCDIGTDSQNERLYWLYIDGNLNIAQYRLVIPITGSDKDLIDSPEFLILTKDQQKNNFVKQPYLFLFSVFVPPTFLYVSGIHQKERAQHFSKWLASGSQEKPVFSI